MNDSLNITLRLADCPPLRMTIARANEENIRRAEYNVNQLWQKWSLRYKDKSSHQVLAMVAFRFAELLLYQSNLNTEATDVLSDFDRRLDAILHNIGEIDPGLLDATDIAVSGAAAGSGDDALAGS